MGYIVRRNELDFDMDGNLFCEVWVRRFSTVGMDYCVVAYGDLAKRLDAYNIGDIIFILYEDWYINKNGHYEVNRIVSFLTLRNRKMVAEPYKKQNVLWGLGCDGYLESVIKGLRYCR